MKKVIAIPVFLLLAISVAFASGPQVPDANYRLAVGELQSVMNGWSAKKAILEKPVYNDQNRKIGLGKDIIIAPDRSVSYIILEVGGILGVGSHKVAIPAGRFTMKDNKLVLPGATVASLKNMPEFRYAK